MTPEATNRKPDRSSLSPVAAASYLTLAIGGVFPAFASYGYWQSGASGLLAAGVAGVICWAAGLLGVLLVGWLREPEQVVMATGLAMIFRMGIPLLAGFFLLNLGGPLVEAGVFGMIVGFYLIALIVETLLAVRLTANCDEDQASKAV